MSDKPLFIPLRSVYYEAFANGSKRVEYRKFGPRWNGDTCRVGREVVISKGYGTQNRMRGVIVGLTASQDFDAIPGWAECYGHTPDDCALCIEIELNREPT